MDERDIREGIAHVRAGALSRRHFTRTMLGLGLTGPMVAQLLALAGVARAQPKPAFTPTRRGGGGELRMLWWQAATILTPTSPSASRTTMARASSTSPWPA